MKLSEKMNRRKREAKTCTAGKILASADRRISASALNGTGQFSIVSPWGVESIPASDNDAVIVAGDSERMCIGVKQRTNSFGLQPGEVVLHAGDDTYIHLRADGVIDICGQVYINGERWEA